MAGIPIQIDILDETGEKGWTARIGCHSDDLGVSCTHSILNELDRSFPRPGL